MAKQRSWDELVRLGREASLRISDAKWTLGDLALEVEPKGATGVHTGALGRLVRYARELDIPSSRLCLYRTMSYQWPAVDRDLKQSWSVHRVLAHNPKRRAILSKLAQDARRKGRRVTCDDASAVLGLPVHPAGRAAKVAVQDHERRFPGTAKPIALTGKPTSVVTMGKPVDTAKRIIDNLKPGQIGELIEYAWSVLEGRRAA